VDANSTNFYSYYRWAVLSRRGATDPAALERIDQALQRASALNASYAPAFQALAEVRLQAGRRDEALAAATRSITLDPAPPSYHVTMARVLSALGRRDEAVRQARDALELSRTDAERRFAQQAIDSLSAAARGASPDAPRPSANGVTMPKLLHEEQPQYTAEALKQKITGSVMVECVVGVDGSVQNARVVRSLDTVYGLDEEALKAARAWRFEPGTRNGTAVPVTVTIELTFTAK
jgi:TonB family protein